MPQTADTGKSPRRSASRPRKGAVAAAPSVWPASARPATPIEACCAATSNTVRLIIPCGRRAHASAAASLRSARCASSSRYGPPLEPAGTLITADSLHAEPGSCARGDQAEPGDPAPERAASHTHIEGELLVALKPHPADGDLLDRHVDLAPWAVPKRLVTLLPDIAGADRRHQLIVKAYCRGRIGIGLPEPLDLVRIRRVRPALRALERRGQQPDVRSR